jgi:hypothetical protein
MLNKVIAYMQRLVTDGGPSLTRWLALRVTEAMTFMVLLMVVTECYCCIWRKGTDAGMISAIVTISVALITATSLNQNTKLTLDAKPSGSPSKIETPTGTITTGTDK